MSWQAYVDSNLVGTGHVSQGAIYGINGGEWAKSAGFQVSKTFTRDEKTNLVNMQQVQPAELQEITAAYANPDTARANGIHINGTKYLLLRADERSIYGKKVKPQKILCIVQCI